MASRFYKKLRNRANSSIGPLYAAQFRDPRNTATWTWLENHEDDLPYIAKTSQFFSEKKLEFVTDSYDFRIVEVVKNPYDEELDHPIIFSICAFYEAK